MPEWKNAWYGRTSRLYLSGFFLDIVKPLVPIADFLKKKEYQTKICDGSIEEGHADGHEDSLCFRYGGS